MMLEEITSELLVTGFVALIHRLWEFLNQEQIDEGFYPLELAGMSPEEYQELVDRFMVHLEEN